MFSAGSPCALAKQVIIDVVSQAFFFLPSPPLPGVRQEVETEQPLETRLRVVLLGGNQGTSV